MGEVGSDMKLQVHHVVPEGRGAIQERKVWLMREIGSRLLKLDFTDIPHNRFSATSVAHSDPGIVDSELITELHHCQMTSNLLDGNAIFHSTGEQELNLGSSQRSVGVVDKHLHQLFMEATVSASGQHLLHLSTDSLTVQVAVDVVQLLSGQGIAGQNSGQNLVNGLHIKNFLSYLTYYWLSGFWTPGEGNRLGRVVYLYSEVLAR